MNPFLTSFHFETGQHSHEVVMPEIAAVLAVSNDLQTDILLHPDCVRDGFILNGAQLVVRNSSFVAIEFLARLHDARRPKQAADVVRAKWRCLFVAHLGSSAALKCRFGVSVGRYRDNGQPALSGRLTKLDDVAGWVFANHLLAVRRIHNIVAKYDAVGL